LKHFKTSLRDHRLRTRSNTANYPAPGPRIERNNRVQTGTIKSYSHQNLWGFIIPDDRSPDLFFHQNNFQGVISDLCAGSRVGFAIGEHNGRSRAVDVRLI
jgi:cold shock CspA family protein